MITFRLNEFKAIAKWLGKHLPGPLAFVAQGWLFGLETSYIDAKASAAVEKGIASFAPPDPAVVASRYHSEPSEVEGLNIIRLTHDNIHSKRRWDNLPKS